MASGSFVFPDKSILNMFEGATALMKNGSSLYRIALVASTWTPNDATDEVWADVSANEIANGNGYTTGGGTLASVTLTQTSGVIKFTSAAYVWTAAGGSIPAWRRAVVYYLGTLNAKVNPIVGYFDGVSGGASDVAATTDTNTLTVTPHGSGIMSATQV